MLINITGVDAIIAPMTPIFRSYFSITIDFSYNPLNDGTSVSSMFDTTIGVYCLISSRKGTRPSIP